MSWIAHFCVVCERRFRGEMDLCEHCLATLPWNEQSCMRCAVPLANPERDLCHRCERSPPDFDQAVAPLLYRDAPARWVQRLKFNGSFREGAVLARLFAEDVAFTGLRVDVIVPIPLSARRLMQRGHNQVAMLCRALSRELGAPLDRRVLARKRHTRAQSDLPVSARRANVAGAFRCRRRLSGEHVALVDDVMTTGETLSAASKVLREAGAGTVTVCAATRTGTEQSQVL